MPNPRRVARARGGEEPASPGRAAFPRLEIGAFVVAVGMSASYASFATGGLETPLQFLLCLVVAVFTLSARPLEPRRSLGLGIATALALGTRLDSVLLIAPLFAALAIRLYGNEGR